MKNVIFAFAVCLALLFGCVGDYSYKGINVPANYVPAACGGKTDCALFSCMASACWCKQGENGGIVLEGGKSRIMGASEMAAYVQAYLDSKGVKYSKVRAVALNQMFYNVFFEEQGSGEQMLTVGIDGTIMQTVCGV